MRAAAFVFACAAALGCAWPEPPTGVGEAAIVGGEPTTDHAAVGAYLVGGGANGLCTATLVADDAALTAAHCADMSNDDDVLFFGRSVFEPGTAAGVDRVTIHPDYDANTARYDLAMLFLGEAVPPDPLPLNEQRVDDDWIGTTLRVVGFGNEDVYAGETAGIKRETEVQLVGVEGPLMFHETEGHNTCSGDSGGPAFVERDGVWTLVGVISFVYPLDPDEDACAGGGGENRVDASLDWIGDQLDLDLVSPGDDDDDDDDESFMIDEDTRGGCAADLTAGRGVRGPGLACLLWSASAVWFSRRRTAPRRWPPTDRPSRPRRRRPRR